MKFELELPKFQFVLMAFVLLASAAAPRRVAAQTTSQAPASAQTQPGCTNPTGSTDQNAAATAASAASKAANTVSNLGSLFGKKKVVQNAGQVASATSNCDAKVNNASGNVANVAAGAASTAATVSPTKSSSTASASATPSSSGAQPASVPAATQPQGSAAPYVPPSGAPTAFTGPLDPSKLPDISGIHVGMNLEDSKAALQKLYPNAHIDVLNGVVLGPQHTSSVGLYRVQRDSTGLDQAQLDFTAQPNQQVVWHLTRIAPQPHVAHNVLVEALRQKYGKETYATGPAQAPATNDSQIMQMWWMFDEGGKLSPSATIIDRTPFGCGNKGSGGGYYESVMRDSAGLSTFCASSYVGVSVTMPNTEIVNSLVLDIVDLPLVVRSAKASDAWQKAEFNKARQQEIQRSNQVKPQI